MKNLARFLGLGNDKIDTDKSELKVIEQLAATAEVIQEHVLEVQNVDIQSIVANPFQPRKLFNDDSLQELSSSIKEYGIIQPLLVRRIQEGYELIAGERRLKALPVAPKKTNFMFYMPFSVKYFLK